MTPRRAAAFGLAAGVALPVGVFAAVFAWGAGAYLARERKAR